MQDQSFDVHARILHSGQYEVRKRTVEVPIRQFNQDVELEADVQKRIDSMNQEIAQLENTLREKRQLSRVQADKIIEQAQDQAKKILEDAEQHAFDRVQKSVHEKEMLLLRASEEVERIKTEAQRDADNIQYEAQKESERLKEQSQKDGHQEGFNKGLVDGKGKITFAVDRLHGIIAETARERERILVHSENQVINLVLTMVSKVVKKLSVEHQDVVIENTKAALELLRGAMTLFIRVSPHDFNYTTSFKEELVRMLESKAELKFIEDPTVEPGGVYIETDMGDVDATIRSQLEELSTQMHFYMPIKVHAPKKDSAEKIQEPVVEKREVPKTEFAQREEYQSTIEVAPEVSQPEQQATVETAKEVTSEVVEEIANDSINETTVESSVTPIIETLEEETIVEDILKETPTKDFKDENPDIVV